MRGFVLYSLILGLSTACAALLNIEEASCDPESAACVASPVEAGLVTATTRTDAGSPEPSPCELFCQQTDDVCPSDLAPYTTPIVCLAVCELYDESQLECRTKELRLARDLSEPATHCPAASIAGTRGDASEGCDTACGAYCRGLADACPESMNGAATAGTTLPVYEDVAACEASCRDNITELPRGLTPLDRLGNTLQCRLWHLAQAAVDPVHCSHARGDCPCGDEAECNATLEP